MKEDEGRKLRGRKEEVKGKEGRKWKEGRKEGGEP